jgi:Zn-dependent peptidase ImmA (M78 family)
MSRVDAEKDASRILLTIWAPGNTSLTTIPIPVDPVLIAKRLGIETFEVELDPNVSGALIKRVGRDPSILLNEKDSDNRKRFSCAHELGHFVRRSNLMQGSEEYEYVDLRGPLASTGENADEVYANQFGAALLMPGDCVVDFWKDGKSPIDLQFAFEVSADAMENRLRSLRLQR